VQESLFRYFGPFPPLIAPLGSRPQNSFSQDRASLRATNNIAAAAIQAYYYEGRAHKYLDHVITSNTERPTKTLVTQWYS
jgi:hypothetical protein